MGIAARLEDVLRTPGDYGVHFIAALEAELPKIDQVIRACPTTAAELLSRMVKGKVERAFPPPTAEVAQPKKRKSRKSPSTKGTKTRKTEKIELFLRKGLSNNAICERIDNLFPNNPTNPAAIRAIKRRMNAQKIGKPN